MRAPSQVAPAVVALLLAGPAMAESLAALDLPELSPEVSDRVRTSAARTPGLDVQDGETTRALVASLQSLGVTCDVHQPSCAAEVGALADVDLVLTGRLDGGAEPATLHLQVTRVATEQRVRAVRGRLDAVEELVEQLMAPGGRTGGLRVEVNLEGAEIFVNDRSVGLSPMKGPLLGLSPGEHRVHVVKGALSFEDVASIPPGETLRVDALLVEPRDFAGVGVSLALGGAGLMLASAVVPTAIGFFVIAPRDAGWNFALERRDRLSQQDPTASHPATAAELAALDEVASVPEGPDYLSIGTVLLGVGLFVGSLLVMGASVPMFLIE